MRHFRLLITILCLACVMTGMASAEGTVLPIDFSGGMTPPAAGYTSEMTYEDPTISVSIEKGREKECDYWIATVKIADASQLRTIAADGFDSNMVMDGTALARRVKAVLAIDGDYYCYTNAGFVVRQGIGYINALNGTRDALLIDEDGDFHIALAPEKGSLTTEIDGKRVINSFNFGPALVVDGEIRRHGYANGMAADKRAQRMAICQTGPLSYKIICCGPPARGSTGMTIEEFAKFVDAQEDVITAYNMDGGDSTMMIFGGKKINDVDNPNTREIADLIYFASAWQGSEPQ